MTVLPYIGKSAHNIHYEAFYIQYLHFSFQLTYMTADFNNTPPAEAETPRNEDAVEYTGVQFAQA